ncbi:hypothetical protein D9613_011039 [Agrocybe pediades]|uniref:Sugar phosphate transporter domain-containing protein n=1 Tax=Agrocybe pediades TaxID=84607 RepID=A0A8H4QKS8_9AGAR|nr:hypothetical protein D9613_011039 [Agrocybe pediades]
MSTTSPAAVSPSSSPRPSNNAFPPSSRNQHTTPVHGGQKPETIKPLPITENTKFLPPTSFLGPSQHDLSTNASYDASQPPLSKDFDLLLAPSRSATHDLESLTEHSHIVRSRALRLNNLHQRVYHNDELSLVSYGASDALGLRTDSQASDASSTSALSEKDQLLFGGGGNTNAAVQTPGTGSNTKTRFYLHRRLASSRRLLPFRIPARLRAPVPRAISRRLSSFGYRLSAFSDSPSLWLGLYFVLNLSLTLYNKSVLIHFPFPYTLTALHAFCGTVGTSVLLRINPGIGISGGGASGKGARLLTAVPQSYQQSMPNLNGKELLVLFLFSILYTLNIVVSNASLRLVTVPFHQVVRSSTPFFTILFAAILLKRRCSKNKLLSLIPVVVGVGFATYGDYYFTALGFFLTLLGTLLAALKTILTNVILVKPSPASSSSVTSSNGVAAISSSGLPIATSPDSPIFPHHHHHTHHARDSSSKSNRPYPPSFFSSLLSLTLNHLFPPSPNSSPAYPTKPLSHGSHVLPMPAVLSPVHEKFSSGTDMLSASASSSAFALPKLSLSPIHLLYLLSPLAFIQTTVLAQVTGELDRVRWHLFGFGVDPVSGVGMGGVGNVMVKGRGWLLLNGVFAFGLNVVSFNANRRVGPLGMSVAANIKQVLTILCAVTIFDLTITPTNGLGIVLTLVGGALYAVVELKEKKMAAMGPAKSRTG